MAALPVMPKFHRATLTEAAIEAAIHADQGNLFRARMEYHMPRVEDAYRQDDPADAFRSHLGASQIGRKCKRELWLKWRWSFTQRHKARIVRLFNRGHREEAVFLAMLDCIGVQFHQPDDGGQERISDHGGHFGSALDGVLYGVPDAPGEWILGEFKTHNAKSFAAVAVKGIAASKPEHYSQIQTCMARRGIFKTLYMAVNKNDDDLFCELIHFDQPHATRELDKGADIITRRDAPARISDDPSNFDCTFCDAKQRCHFPHMSLPPMNCRTCIHSVADIPSGTWGCELLNVVLDKKAQMAGCDQHSPLPDLMAR